MSAYMCSVKVISMDYGRIYAFVNLFNFPYCSYNY